MEYVATAAPIIIKTFSNAFFFILIPERTAMNIPEKKETIAALITEIITAVKESIDKAYAAKKGLLLA